MAVSAGAPVKEQKSATIALEGGAGAAAAVVAAAEEDEAEAEVPVRGGRR